MSKLLKYETSLLPFNRKLVQVAGRSSQFAGRKGAGRKGAGRML
jgi:hypothetical protein